MIKNTLLLTFIVLMFPILGSAQGPVSRPIHTKEVVKTEIKGNNRISNPDGYICGHGYVDLGLPSGVMWATTNIGSNSPFDNGYYFAWGEVKTKNDYSMDNYSDPRINFSSNVTEICNTKYDAASCLWGNDWEIPSKELCDELINNCILEWTKIGSKNGWKVTGKNGNSIFLPAAGSIVGPNRMNNNIYTSYWTGTSTNGKYKLVFEIYLRDYAQKTFRTSPYVGLPIRAITRKPFIDKQIKYRRDRLNFLDSIYSDSINAPTFGL